MRLRCRLGWHDWEAASHQRGQPGEPPVLQLCCRCPGCRRRKTWPRPGPRPWTLADLSAQSQRLWRRDDYRRCGL
jgi:hypothetical protein